MNRFFPQIKSLDDSKL